MDSAKELTLTPFEDPHAREDSFVLCMPLDDSFKGASLECSQETAFEDAEDNCILVSLLSMIDSANSTSEPQYSQQEETTSFFNNLLSQQEDLIALGQFHVQSLRRELDYSHSMLQVAKTELQVALEKLQMVQEELDKVKAEFTQVNAELIMVQAAFDAPKAEMAEEYSYSAKLTFAEYDAEAVGLQFQMPGSFLPLVGSMF